MNLRSKKYNPSKVWEKFYHKYPITSHENKYWYELRLTEEEKNNWYQEKTKYQKKFTHDQKSEEKEKLKPTMLDVVIDLKRIRKIQNLWKSKRSGGNLLQVNPQGNHSSAFKELVHSKKVKKSINKKKLEDLGQLIQKGQWNHTIFEDPHIQQLTLSLFSSNQITQQQTSTILERVQHLREFKHMQTASILDEHEQFTLEALSILIPALSGKNNFKKFSPSQIEKFRLLVSKLPKSEQIFYITNGFKYMNEKVKQATSFKPPTLGVFFIDFAETIHKVKNISEYRLVNLSTGVRDALGIVKFGIKNYVRMVPTLGTKTPKEIEEGVKQKKRYGALDFPETVPWTNIHDIRNVTNYEATEHDIYHANVMSTLTSEMQDGFLRLAQCVRDITQHDLKSEWSKEIWDWIDCEYLMLFYKNNLFDTERFRRNNLTIKEVSILFCNLLIYNPPKHKRPYLLHDNNITPLGVIFILDFIKNKDKWNKLKIDFNALDENHVIKKYYKEIDDLHHTIENDPPKIQIFKILIYQTLKNYNMGKEKYSHICDMVSEQFDLETQLKFKKNTSKDQKAYPEHTRNSIYFTFKNARHENNKCNYEMIENLIQVLAEKYIGSNNNDIQNFKKAVLILNYSKEEAIQYVNNKNLLEVSDLKIQYKIKPTLLKWVKLNLIKSFLSLGIIPLLYGNYKVWQQNHLNATAEHKAHEKLEPILVAPDTRQIFTSSIPILPDKSNKLSVKKLLTSESENIKKNAFFLNLPSLFPQSIFYSRTESITPTSLFKSKHYKIGKS